MSGVERSRGKAGSGMTLPATRGDGVRVPSSAPGGTKEQAGTRPGLAGSTRGSTLLPRVPLRARATRTLRRLRGLRAVLAVAVLLLAAVVGHRVGDMVRGTPVRNLVVVDSTLVPGSAGFAREAAAAAQLQLRPGNRIRVIQDADLFPDLLEDLRAARSSILVACYFCQPGRMGDGLAAVLAERARDGVAVFLLGDGFGCREYLDAVEQDLRGAGAAVASHRPVRWWALHRAQHRNHGRAVVVDGTIGYTGGFGIADEWLGRGGAPPWRETSVRFQGPAVADLEAAFTAAWAEATGDLLVFPGGPEPMGPGPGDLEFMDPGPADPRPTDLDPSDPGPLVGGTPFVGDGSGEFAAVAAGLLVSRPGLGATAADRFLTYSLEGAGRTLYIANSYFVPTRHMRRMLADAARRGVDVRLLLPGPVNDVPSTRWAGQRHFQELLEAGVRIWLYQEGMMHAKTLTVDGRWGTVGSMNMDNRSLRLNEEWSLVFDDPRLGAHMDSLFLADLERSRERTLAEHAARPLWDRVREWLASLVEPLL
jgi:cardiolipin synthase